MKNPLLFLFLFFTLCFQAQESTVVAGGDIHNEKGWVSYTVGQAIYEFNSEASGTTTDGVQQPYHIFELMGTNDLREFIDISLYPNPTADQVNLQVGNPESFELSYRLFDLNGKLLESRQLDGSETTISMRQFASGIYHLKVNSDDKEIVVFKILKTN